MTPQQADAATLRAIAERMQSRGEDGLYALTLQMARWVEDCAEVPPELVAETLAAVKAERKG